MYYRESFSEVVFPTGLSQRLAYGLMLCVKVSTAQNPLQLTLNLLTTGLNKKSHKEIQVQAFFLGSWRDLSFANVIQ